MQNERVPERVYREPFEILEIDDAALFGADPDLNTCCNINPINSDCLCFFNVLLGCGDQGCGSGNPS